MNGARGIQGINDRATCPASAIPIPIPPTAIPIPPLACKATPAGAVTTPASAKVPQRNVAPPNATVVLPAWFSAVHQPGFGSGFGCCGCGCCGLFGAGSLLKVLQNSCYWLHAD